ncbi:fatty acyl-AMP ligase [Streptoalloteichus hindustanus]|uniref:Acyl-CoA synthetase (AMP-forming)/AMP-acid ligase II n=1 Tax=Streptoalloteichus hindustanus TaxID=2017 RepID=A0A1M4ZG31_STRHI|nr:fatty acyl-AMP ligase [Streptoalloteichus hindustanus]SHF16747.1 Acyl-CoA synthetase (AMP-forming)/AMP-acid ligase II [Streptoalloteichus hindustanus]
MNSHSAVPVVPRNAPRESLATLLRWWAGELGDEPALTRLDYTRDPGGVAETLTWRELDAMADAVALRVAPDTAPGDRIAIMAGQSLAYVAGFLGVLRARRIAVPLFPPGSPHDMRLAAILADCSPSLILTTSDLVDGINRFRHHTGSRGNVVVPMDTVDTGKPYEDKPPRLDELAYLQYTSGSTRSPAGVMVSHGNVLANARQAAQCYGAQRGRTVNVSWLPLFHDMGLMLAVATPVLLGARAVLLDPTAFLERPGRWLQALSANPGAITAAPSFAYSYAAARCSARERALLRLDDVVTLVDGSEQVLPSNIDRFHNTFAECGLRRETHRPSYGLAEATVLVTANQAGTAPRVRTFDARTLAAGRAIETVGVPSSTLVGCGRPVDQRVRIVEPRTCKPLPDGRVGEIWVSGPNVGLGYWGRPKETRRTFGLALDAPDDPLAAGEDGRGWLRTGDLGVVVDGELFVTGRIKDLIVIDGRNHYPQDIELTVERAHPAVRRHSVAAFAIPGDEGERLVVVAERARDERTWGTTTPDVVAAARAAVASTHGVSVHDMWLLEPGQTPRTSSGKISRAASRVQYLAHVRRSTAS